MNCNSEPAQASSATAWTQLHLPVIHMGAAVELLGQEIARRVAKLEAVAATSADQSCSDALTTQITMLRRQQPALRSDDPVGVQAVFNEFGRGYS